MKFLPLAAALVLIAAPAAAQAPPGSVAKPVGQFNTTMSGQPILLPQGPVQVTVTETSVPAGGLIAPTSTRSRATPTSWKARSR
uniref:Uncharacterized protein n=1 Tax=Phenylobacterium glaciei TaxID=2803784 RepID=A0A974P2W7_9CAUL|nr:hypothetical protein JKL49_21185 [Phenylobacterium glaciei]